MLLGVDFDNTIVCYDGVFHRVAVDLKLIPPGIGTGKNDVRDWLRAAGREDDWTRLQGIIYGTRILAAPPFPGVIDFFRGARVKGVRVMIISHKTRQPYLGEPCDLHEAAMGWLEHHGFFEASGAGLSRGDVCLELTKQEKLGRIAQARCTHFVDDLPEFLSESAFPQDVRKVLWDPRGQSPAGPWTAITAWKQLWAILENRAGAPTGG
ncbi:MAG: hypothetical protein IT442_08975 [Phycisphaeraceae bacterium]|nr:hypothetical protein [Phycisphaeraceae bacterium]